MADLLAILGTQIRARRKALNLTQEELAERAGLSVDMIGRVERGASGLLLEKLAAVATALDTAPGALLGYEASIDNITVDRRAALEAIHSKLAGLSMRDLEWIGRLIQVSLER